MSHLPLANEARLANMADYAKGRGFNVRVDAASETIAVEIPYGNSAKLTGTMWHEAQTWAELRTILGY